MEEQIATPMIYYRGGTSKAAYIDRRDLPTTKPEDLDAWILAIYGSPDKRQIDGIGGADLLTSKFAVIGPPTREGADVDYSFFQVGVDEAVVYTDVNCGNISAGVGPYAIEQGFVEATDGPVEVHVHSTNFDRMIHITVETQDGRPRVHGDAAVQGVPGTGAPIRVDFRDMSGTHQDRLLPTGEILSTVEVEGIGTVETSVVDLANLVAFVRADVVGLTGTENPAEMQDDADLMERCERIRLSVAVAIGLADTVEEANRKDLATPFLVVVGEPAEWTDFATGETHKADEADFVARSVTRRQVHKAFPGTGSAATAVAALMPGSVVNQIAHVSGTEANVSIGHPCGVLELDAAIEETPHGADPITVTKAVLVRTARRIMDGRVYAAKDRLPWLNDSTSTGGTRPTNGAGPRPHPDGHGHPVT